MTVILADSARDDRAAVDKAVSLLVALGEGSGGGAGVSELARRARLSKTTAYQVPGMLERTVRRGGAPRHGIPARWTPASSGPGGVRAAGRAGDGPAAAAVHRPHITDPDELSAELDRIRPTGVAFDDEEHQPGLVCVAVPGLDRDGRLRRRRWPAGTAVSTRGG
ncbi:IclR family transcriptional regulator domain-containing protein [Streptomyces sp. NPDC002845]